MKHEKHIDRRSFERWAMAGQRTETLDSEELFERRAAALFSGRKVRNIGKNNGPLKESLPAQNTSTQFRLAKHSCVVDPMGARAKVIPSYAYFPQPKAPSRRDKHREAVRVVQSKVSIQMGITHANA